MHRVIARMCVMEISIDIKVVAWCTSYQLHAQGSVSIFGYHFSLCGVIGRVWISFFPFYIAIISCICSIICVCLTGPDV